MSPDSHSSRRRRNPSSSLVAVVLLAIVFRVSVAFSDLEGMNGFTTSAEADSHNGLQANSEITLSPSTLFKSSAYASSENRSTVILASLPSSVSDNRSATVPSPSYTIKSKSEEDLLKTNAEPLNSSEVLSVSSSTVPVSAFSNREQLENSTEKLNSAFTVTDNQFFTITSYYADDNSTAGNGTALTGGSSLPLMAICILVSLGAFAVVVIITVACVCHRRRKKKLQAGSLYLQTRGESSNEYENLDNVTEFVDGIIPRRGNVRVYPDSSVGFHSRSGPMWLPRTHSSGLSSATAQQSLFDDYRLLNEYLLTLKRPLENYITNDSISEDLKSYMTNASSKIFDIIGQNTGNANLRRPRIVPPLRSFAYEILYSDVFILENFLSLHLQIANLLRVFPTNETEPIIRQCRRSLESVDALLKIGTENVSYTSLVKSGYNDVLLDANPLFRELLGQLTIVRLRLESYYLINVWIEPDDAWKSKLLDCLTEAESMIVEAFSDVLQSSDDAEPETAAVDQDFHQLLKSRLLKFRQSTDPVMPQVKSFLQGINGNAAYYVSITLDEIGHLTTNILDPAAASTLPEYDELNPDFFYQNLPSIYDLPHRSVYSLPSQAEVDVNLTGSSLSRDLGTMQSETDDLYEESPGALNETLGDISDAYDDDCFEVSVDRMSPSSLEDVLTLYKSQSTEQLQRSVRVSFIGESGVDGGALSREFFFMTFNSLIGQPLLSHLLFEGSRGHLLPAIDHFLTDNKVYWFVGVLIAQAVNRGCRGLPGLCNAVRHFLSLGAKIKNIGQSLEKVTVEDIADGELRGVIEKVQKKESLTEEERSVFEDWARDSNFSKVLNPTTELEAVQRIFAHYVFNSRMTQLQAISEGISDVSLRNNQASEIERMFPADEKLTYDDFMSGILIEPSTKCQRKAHKYFKRFCEELYGGKVGDLTLEALLQFFSGAPYFVSMVGAQVRFAEPHERNALPVAHACASELIIPTVHTDYASFRGALVKALEYSGTGFGIP